MSLADELLADFEELEELEDDRVLQMDVSEQKVEDDGMEVATGLNSVRNVATLRYSERLKRVMREIEQRSSSETNRKVFGPAEADPEYHLIVEANSLAVEIDNEINIIHKFTRDSYSKRFPELESLVPGALQYLSTAKELGNEVDKAKNSVTLQQFLTPATIMVLCVTASTTQGRLLTNDELDVILEACNMATELNDFKLEIYTYVESRMSFIAPNLSVIVGAPVAAKLMGVAGGLTNLSKIPACNILVLGSQQKSLTGFSTGSIMPHVGFVYSCDIVQDTPADLRRKAANLVAAKCAMASRIDMCRQSPTGDWGRNFREDIVRKLEKLQEPPPVKQEKPLPVPVDKSQKKRGGRRVRKMKERYGVTELRKQANRMNFGVLEEDAYQDDLGFSAGQTSGTGRIRAPKVDEKTKVRISKTLQRNLQKQQDYGGNTSVRRQISGTASVVFTPSQGLEIIGPQAAEEKRSEPANRYFSQDSRFTKVGRKDL